MAMKQRSTRLTERFLARCVAPLREGRRRFALVQLAVLLGVVALYALNAAVLEPRTGGTLAGRFFSGYFADLLAPAALLSASNLVFAFFGFGTSGYLPVALITIVAGVCWEFAAPLVNPASVTDPLDLAAYLLGSLGYWAVTRRVAP